MPKMNIKQPNYFKGEFYGSPNSGKSRCALSICIFAIDDSAKKKIIYLVNESTWKDSIGDFPDYHHFEVYYHVTLEELITDWKSIMDEYSIENPSTKVKEFNYAKFESEVLAIVLDESEYIYREGYVKRYMDKNRMAKMTQSDWGSPRAELLRFFKQLYSKPCHVFVNSKVGFEYEGVRNQKADGTLGALTFVKTGKETYRLPDATEYEPNLRMHLYSTLRDRIIDEKNPKNTEPEFDESGELIMYYTFWGKILKNKADRDKQPLIINPDMTKIQITLARLLRLKLKKLKVA